MTPSNLPPQQSDSDDPRTTWVQNQLHTLSPGSDEGPAPTNLARARLQTRLTQSQKEPMMKIFNRRLLVPLALVLLFSFSLVIPAVRVAAADFLGLFRVEQIAVVEFNPANLPNFNMTEGDMAALMDDQMNIVTTGEPEVAATQAEAEALAGYDVRFPAATHVETQITVQPGAESSMQVDAERWQTLIDSLDGIDFDVPDELDGETISVSVPKSVTFVDGNCEFPEGEEMRYAGAYEFDCTSFVQMPSPSVSAPATLDIQALGQAFLQLFGMSEADAQAMSRSIDWTSTLILPIPQNADYQPVTVEGVEGAFLADDMMGENMYMLIWVKDGMLYALSGQGTVVDALSVVSTLQ